MGDEIEEKTQLGIGSTVVPFLQVGKTEDMEEIKHSSLAVLNLRCLHIGYLSGNVKEAVKDTMWEFKA